MTEPLSIRKGERGVIRLFALDLDKSQIGAFANPSNAKAASVEVWPLRSALGVDDLDAKGVTVIDIAELGGMGLATYLMDGEGVAETDLTPHRAEIDTLSGHLVILRSTALPNGGTLTPSGPLRHVATLGEGPPDTEVGDLPSDGARTPSQAKRPMSKHRASGMAATAALLVMFLLVGLMVWVAS